MGIVDFLKGSKISNFEKNIMDMSGKIFKASAHSADKLTKELDKHFENKNIADYHVSILSQFIYFHLHMTDRETFSILGAEQRSNIMDRLVDLTFTSAAMTFCNILGFSKSRIPDLESSMYDEMNYFNNIYGKCTSISNENEEGLGKALIWNFGKNIAGLIEEENEIAVITTASMAATESLLSCKPGEMLKAFA